MKVLFIALAILAVAYAAELPPKVNATVPAANASLPIPKGARAGRYLRLYNDVYYDTVGSVLISKQPAYSYDYSNVIYETIPSYYSPSYRYSYY